jgi:hypothetical protein
LCNQSSILQNIAVPICDTAISETLLKRYNKTLMKNSQTSKERF